MQKTFKGIPTSGGIAIAKVHHLTQQLTSNQERSIGFLYEQNRIKNAIHDAVFEIESMLNENLSVEAEGILLTQIAILKDPELISNIENKIRKNRINAAQAFELTMNEFIEIFKNSNNHMISEKTADLKDIKYRVLKILNQENKQYEYNEEVILVAEELYPSETIKLDKTFIKGIITEKGSKTSHAAILSKQMGIPSISGIDIHTLKNDDLIILDGDEGLIIVNPKDETIRKYQSIRENFYQLKEKMKYELKCLTETQDGKEIHLLSNLGSTNDIPKALKNGALGVGLYRSENDYFNLDNLPKVSQLKKIYQKILSSFKSKVIIRTLDVGGDKMLPYLEPLNELNPFLGKRGIRFSLSNIDIFKTQIKALLLSNETQNLHIMLPMISTLDELLQAKSIIEEVKSELKNENIQIYEPKIGMMLEVPSALLAIEDLLPNIDFISIGTNDLLQYLFAADRMNDEVSYLYQPFHPVVIKSLKYVVDKAKKYGINISVCGEMASDITTALMLIGLGIDELSVHSKMYPQMNYVIRRSKIKELESLVEKAMKLKTNQEVFELFNQYKNELMIS